MSSTGNVTSTETATEQTINQIVGVVESVVTALAPIAAAVEPNLAAGIVLGQKIVLGALALEPEAVQLYNSIISGVTPTAGQLAQFSSNYEAAYQQLDADIKAKLALLPSS